jgi:hypothetical protein
MGWIDRRPLSKPNNRNTRGLGLSMLSTSATVAQDCWPAGLPNIRFAAVVIALTVAFATPWLIQFGAAQSFQTRPDLHIADYAKGWIWAAVLSASIFVWPIRQSM